MSRLEIRLLGPLEVILDGEQVTGFESNKVRLLVAYLAVETGRPQPREKLASLLWPDWPQKSALSNLRYALSDLRKNIGDRKAEPPFLNISRESIQFNLRSNCWVDTSELERLQSKGIDIDTKRLERLVRSYRGPFLDGFSVEDSSESETGIP